MNATLKRFNILMYLKCFYQTFKIKFNFTFFSFFFNSKIQSDLLSSNLKKRKFSWNNNLKFKTFLILSVNDWEVELIDAFNKNGETYLYSWENIKNFFKSKLEWQKSYNKINTDLIKAFDNFYDNDSNILVFLYASDFTISTESINYIKRNNVFIVSFCWDDILYFKGKVNNQPVGINQISRFVDLNLTMSPETLSRYFFNSTPCIFWNSSELVISQENEIYLKNISDEFYILFIGSNYGWRKQFIKQIIESGFKVICYGQGWENGKISIDEVKRQIEKAPLTLGFSNIGYTKDITTIKGRDFEVPLWKGLYLTQYSKGLEYYYSTEQDILTYKDIKDCINKIHFVKNNPDKALTIRINGYNKALKFATWDSRINFLINFLNKEVF